MHTPQQSKHRSGNAPATIAADMPPGDAPYTITSKVAAWPKPNPHAVSINRTNAITMKLKSTQGWPPSDSR